MTISERLMSRCLPSPTGCLEWQGYRNRYGYGVIGVGSRKDGTRRTILAHRLSFILFVGPLEDNLNVLHHCDNPPCIRPEHLYKGTDLDNRRDMLSRGREVVLRGEQVGTSKLTEGQVREIKRLLGYRNDGILARKFGVSDSLIFNIRHGISWKHVHV